MPSFVAYASCRVDIPLQALHLLFNGRRRVDATNIALLIPFLEVTHPVVAQANPHVHLFFFSPRGSAGKPVAHRKNKGTIQLALELLHD
jgi:hypothetical protein